MKFGFFFVTVVIVKMSRCLPYYINLFLNQKLFSRNVAQEESTIGRANMSNWTPLDISDAFIAEKKTLQGSTLTEHN